MACSYQWPGIDLVGYECGQGQRGSGGWPVGVHRPPAAPGIVFPWQVGAERVCTGQPRRHLTVSVPANVTAKSSVQERVVINIRLLAWLAGPGEVEVLVGVSL